MERENTKTSLLCRWKNKQKNEGSSIGIKKAPEGVEIPLSHAQQRLWFLQQQYPSNPFYNYSEYCILRGSLHTDAIKKALTLIFKEQKLLNSYCPVENDKPVLKSDNEIELQIEEFDFTTLNESEAKVEADKIMSSCATTHFDLSRPPLYRICLLRLNHTDHILFMTLHHIITDIWSMGILKDQLASYYKDISQGFDVQPNVPEIQFSDFAYWDRNKNTDKEQLDYWKKKLAGEIPVLDLPFDHERRVKPSYKGIQSTLHFSTQLSDTILKLAKKLDVTPFTLLLSVYYVLMLKYSGQKDISIGTPISTRNQKSLEGLVGFFLDTVVLRLQIDPLSHFSKFVRYVNKNTLEGFSNKDIPFDVLVKELKPERSININPFFQVMFLYHAEAPTVSFGPEIQVLESSEFDTGVSKFDLTLYVSEHNGRLSATFEYDTDLFEASTISRLLEHYELLLEGITTCPNQSIAEIPMITLKEKSHFFPIKNQDIQPFRKYDAIHKIIEDVSLKHAKETALVFGLQSMSYENLNEEADRYASRILAQTKGKNEIVGLCLDRSLEMIVGALGILKAGCAYLPIDPEYPSKRIDYMLNDSNASILVSHSSKTVKFKNFQGDILCVDEEQNGSYSSPIDECPPANRNNLAYVIYTSGSTGKPKGVPITHNNIINSTEGRLNFYPENPESFLLMSSISFDSSMAGIFWTLCTGGTLVIAEKRIEQDLDKVSEIIVSNNVSHTLMLPSLYGLLLEHGNISKLYNLSNVIVAGEACPSSLCKAHFNKLPHTTLYNEYGPTEATVWCIAHQIKSEHQNTMVPIGKPVANAKIYLLDDNLSLVPFGAIGEIYVGGPGLANGYLNKPELDNKAYFDDPFSDNPDDKLYKTGDLGRYQTDGSIIFLGRSDQQVKIRGHRIELDEVENAVLDLAIVDQVTVIIENKGVLKQLIAFVKVAETTTDLEEIKRKLKNRLPDYMIPSKFIKIDSFPLLPNGKIDKKQLAELKQDDFLNAAVVRTEPTNEIQEKLVEIWQEVLQVTSIGIDDNFFEIGGDSISSIQIIAKARKSDITLKANELFEHQTIAELSLFVGDGKSDGSPEEVIEGEVLLTPIQHWFFEVHTAAPHYWNQIVQISNIDQVDVSVLKEIVVALIRYHDALRLSFIKNGNEWKAHVLSTDAINAFKYFDLGNIEDSDLQNKRIKETTVSEQQNCRLSEGNLFRSLYFHCGNGRKPVVYFIAHHLVVDMVSWNSIFSDFSIALQQRMKNIEISFKPKSDSIRAWGEFLKKRSESPQTSKELSFWIRQKNTSGLFPTDFDLQNSFLEERNIAVFESILDEESTRVLLNDSNSAYNTKVEDLMITALTNTICQWAQLETFCLGLERHGRSIDHSPVDVSNTVGWFTSFFPFTLLTSKSSNLDESIKSVKEQLRSIPDHGVGYGILKYLAENKPLNSLNQRPELIFNYLGIQRTSFEKSAIGFEYVMEGYRDPLSERTYLIEINAYILNDRLRMNWSYSTEVYKASTIQGLANKFIISLQEIINYCAAKEQSNYTPSDFPEAEISQDELDDLMRRL